MEVQTAHGRLLFIETYIRDGINNRRQGIFVYLVVREGTYTINPSEAVYCRTPQDDQEYSLRQLCIEHRFKSPVLSFFIPPKKGNRGKKFYRMEMVNWGSYGLQLADKASDKLAGEGLPPHSLSSLPHDPPLTMCVWFTCRLRAAAGG